MKVTDNDFISFLKNATEVGIRDGHLPKYLSMSEKSQLMLRDMMNELFKRNASIETQVLVATAFMRGYAEGKYRG